MIDLIIKDGFLPFPNVIRSWALSQEYYTCEEYSKIIGYENNWPGKRTKKINVLDQEYADIILNNFCNLVHHSFGLDDDIEISSCFQLTLEEDGDSWIHMDNDVKIAAVLYLTPDAPFECGTTLYSNSPHVPIDVIGNVYNRLIIYRSNIFHKSTKYFGTNKETGRLTQVFFIS